MKIKYSTLHVLLLLFLIASSKNYFNLLPDNNRFSDITLIIISLITMVMFIRYFNVTTKYAFRSYVLLTLLFVIYSAWNEKVLYGQPFMMGLLPQRNFFSALLMYFPLRKYFQQVNIELKTFYLGILYLGSLSCMLYILQKIVILVGGAQFIHVPYSFAGYFTGYRLYVGSSLIILSTLIATAYFLDTLKFKFFFHCILGWFTQLWITQGRIEMISLLIGTVVCIVLQGRFSIKKLIYWLFSVIGFWLITLTPVFQNIVGAILKVDGAGRGSDSLTIRSIGRQLYWDQLNESVPKLLFGTGFPNYQYPLAFQRTGFERNIFLTDNGISTYMYIYGLLGTFLILLLFLKYIIHSLQLLRNTKDIIPLLYIVVLLSVAYNIILWYWSMDGALILVIMMCALEHGKWQFENQLIGGDQ